GFDVRGTIESTTSTRRTITYDIAPKSESVKEVPPISLVVFDTTPPASYRTLTTSALRIDVKRATGNVRAAADTTDLEARDRASTARAERSRELITDRDVARSPLAIWIAVAVGSML